MPQGNHRASNGDFKAYTDIFQSIRRDGAGAISKIRALNDLAIKNASGESLLHAAISYGNDDAAEELITLGANVNAQDLDGLAPLHYAASHGNERIAELILDSGGDVTQVDHHGNSPLWTAVFNAHGKYGIVIAILGHGGKQMAKVSNKHGRSPFDFALQIGDKTLLKLLES